MLTSAVWLLCCVVVFIHPFLSLEKVEEWSGEAIIAFFTQLIEIEGNTQFWQQFDSLHPNCGSPDRSERGIGDGMSGRG